MQADAPITADTILGGRLILSQPAHGYRFAIDPVLLAACLDPKPGDRVLDVGCGVGTAALCLAWRCERVHVVGLDIQAELTALATENALRNGLDGRVQFITGDITEPHAIGGKSMDQVMMNPPHFVAGSHTPPEDTAKAVSHMEASADLGAWVKGAARCLRDKGALAVIHRADRLADLIVAMQGRFGDLTVLPLWPKSGRPAKRVIVTGIKTARGPAKLLPGITLHGENGAFTDEVETVLKSGHALLESQLHLS